MKKEIKKKHPTLRVIRIITLAAIIITFTVYIYQLVIYIKSFSSGDEITLQRLSFDNEEISSTELEEIENIQIFLSLDMSCPRYTTIEYSDGDQNEPLYNYPFTFKVEDAKGNTLKSEEIILSEENITRQRNLRRFFTSKSGFRLSFETPLYTNDKPSSQKNSISDLSKIVIQSQISPDTEYYSKLHKAEIILRTNYYEYSPLKFVMATVIFTFTMLILVVGFVATFIIRALKPKE